MSRWRHPQTKSVKSDILFDVIVAQRTSLQVTTLRFCNKQQPQNPGMCLYPPATGGVPVLQVQNDNMRIFVYYSLHETSCQFFLISPRPSNFIPDSPGRCKIDGDGCRGNE